MSRKVLFFCAIASQFPELISVARFLKREGFNVLFIFGTSSEDNKNCLNSCAREGIKYILFENIAINDKILSRKSYSRRGMFLIGKFIIKLYQILRRFGHYGFFALRKIRSSFFLTIKYVVKLISILPIRILKIGFYIGFLVFKHVKYRPVFLTTLKSSGKRLLNESLKFVLVKTNLISQSYEKLLFSIMSINPKKTVIQRVRNSNLQIYCYHILAAGKYVGNNVRLCELVIHVHRPDLLIVPIETVGYFFDPVAPLARKKGIPIINIPFCYVSKESTANWFLNHPLFKTDYGTYTIINKIIAKLFSNWVFVHKGEKVLRSNFAWILVYWFYKITKKYPWIDNQGFADVVLVESQYFANLHAEQGVPVDKIKVTGSLQHDMIYNLINKKDYYKRQLCNQLGLEYCNCKKLVLLSFPDEFDFSNRPCEFNNHDDIRKAMLKPLSENTDVRVVISLHPRLSYESVKHLESPSAKIGSKPIAELLPCADVFITVTSAAIRLAISCGLPVIDYDVFRYNDKYYNSAGGVITVQAYEDYDGTVSKILDDEVFCASLQERQREASITWGLPDGHAGKRLLNLVSELVGIDNTSK